MPLLLLYEGLAALLGRQGAAEVRNGADVLLKNLFLLVGGANGLLLFGLALALVGGWLVSRDLRQHGAPRVAWFVGMLLEATAYATILGVAASWLTTLLLGGGPLAASAAVATDFPTQVMLSLGAGLYEELLFRVLLVSVLLLLARRGFGWGDLASGAFAVVLSALVFSAFHYIGPYGDQFALSSFTYRAVAGLMLSGLYVTRGFGIVAWSHALYDVMLAALGGWG
ncbi:MAG: CPBP family glutamic-type intramembrane protease [Gemmatimonadales bacterium]